MEIKATDVKALRDATGAGMMDAKKALIEAAGDGERAKALLREWGVTKAGKLSERSASEGVVDAYLHAPDPNLPAKVGVLVEVNCATDFVAKTERFRDLAREIAMHIAASSPSVVDRDQLPEEMVKTEREIIRNQALAEGKPEAVVEKIIEGRLNSFYALHCLVDQPWVRDDKKSIGQLLQEASAEVGEPVRVRRFARFRLGVD